MNLEDEKQLLQGWRGRRLLAYRATDVLDSVIAALGSDNGTDPPPDTGLPAVSEAMKIELQNSAANLLRLILIMNDGHVSGTKLKRW